MPNKFTNFLKEEGVKKDNKKSKFTSFLESENQPVKKHDESSFLEKVVDVITYPQRKTEEVLTGGEGYEKKFEGMGLSTEPTGRLYSQFSPGPLPGQEEIRPSQVDLASEASRMVLDPINIISAVPSKAVAGAMGRAAAVSTAKRLASQGAKIPIENAARLGKILTESGLNKYMNKPVKMYEKIVGKVDLPTEEILGDAHDFIAPQRSQGLVGKMKSNYIKELKKLRTRASKLNAEKVKMSLVEDLAQKRGIEPSQITEDIADSLYRDVDKILVSRGIKSHFNKGKLDIIQAQALKEDIGKFLNSKEFQAVSDNKDIKAEKELLVKLYRDIKSGIEDAATGLNIGKTDAGQFIKAQNQRMGELTELANTMKSKVDTLAQEPGTASKLLETSLAGGIGAGTAMATGFNPLIGAGIGIAGGGMYTGAGRKIAEGIVGGLTRPTVAGLKAGSKVMASPAGEIATKSIPVASGAAKASLGDNYREPQSLATDITDMKLPRDSQWLKDNQDSVLLKIAQNKPEMLEAAQEAFRSQDHNMDNIAPVLARMAPELFEIDKYNRFDNIIMDPEMRMLARKDILKDSSISNTERIKLINKLNLTGELSDY